MSSSGRLRVVPPASTMTAELRENLEDLANRDPSSTVAVIVQYIRRLEDALDQIQDIIRRV